ncbi:ABC transporter permease [Flexithrix dorotheae]|uniref:ABC transporter permease n=1 Tax=Flexithrix dorotheae TaxID=70993 RepID=UPI0003763F08|nr:ABC transporter permease [Flexithrix dorotheae]
MIWHTIRFVIRILLRQKFYTILNILGLSVGIVSCILILSYVNDELTFDQFHQNYEKAFRVNTFWGNDPSTDIFATTPPPLKEVIQTQIPEIEYVARVAKSGDITMRFPEIDGNKFSNQVFRETNVFNVEKDFLRILDFNFIRGDIRTALSQPESMVISKATALRYFGQEKFDNHEIVGNKIETGGDGNLKVITGIVDPPENTHFSFDFLCSVDGNNAIMNNDLWVWNIVYTYFKLKPEIETAALGKIQNKLDQIAMEYCRPAFSKNSSGKDPLHAEISGITYQLQPVADIHLHSHYLRELKANGNLLMVNALILIASIILILAVINFINLSIAQSLKRLKEVGVKKVLGSGKPALVLQFLVESVLLTLLATVLAFGMAELLRVPFNGLTGKNLSFNWISIPLFFPVMIAVSVIIGLLAGAYPAVLFSGYSPTKILKGVFKKHKSESHFLKSGLVVFQFVISIGLIICTMVVQDQVKFMSQKDLGFDKENVIIIKNDMEIDDGWEEFKDYLKQNPAIKEVSFATNFPTKSNLPIRDFLVEETGTRTGINWTLIDEDYQKVLKMEMISGMSFSKSEALAKNGLILNEKAVSLLGLKNPIGKVVIKNPGENDEERLEVIGVVKDFNFESFREEIKPLAFQYYRPHFLSDFIAVRTAPKSPLKQSLNWIEEGWKEFQEEDPFVYSFLDQDFDYQFKSEKRFESILEFFAILAIFIACLGLLGLSSFTIKQKQKEIGIRKVLGASPWQLIFLLSGNYIKLVLLAFCITIPMSYYLVTLWLEGFAYKVPIDFSLFMQGGIFTMILAWLTIAFHCVKTSQMNPVNAIKAE